MPSIFFLWKPNAGRQARLKAGAQRTLEAVACTPMFGPVLVQGPRETVPDTLLFAVVANWS
jgi:hypothetical protein